MTITDLANDTFIYDLDSPSDTSIPAIAQWYRVHISDLNNLINNGYTINSSYEIVDSSGVAINEDAASIFKKLFEIYYLKKQSKSFLGANGVDSISQVTQDGITFKGIERNGIAKTYNELYKEAKGELKTLLNNYKFNRATALQVEGDDTDDGCETNIE
jgi:hypothetical protein